MFGKIKERELGQQRERERKRGNESEKEREIDHEEEIGRGVARYERRVMRWTEMQRLIVLKDWFG